MSTEDPFRPRRDDTNPYAPPEAALEVEPVDLILTGDLAAAETVRREHIGHEASIKSIGILHYVGAGFGVLATVFTVFASAFVPAQGNPYARWILLGVGVFYLAISGLHLALGIGLTRLQPWARWTEVVLIALLLGSYGIAAVINLLTQVNHSALGIIFFVSLILGYILYLLLAAKATTIFSAEYKTIIAQTPHIKYQMSLLLKLALALLVAIIALGVLAVVVGAIVGRAR